MCKERPLQSMGIVIGPCWTNFCSPKLKRRILATFGFNRTALCATQSKLHSMFCALFLKIALSTAELMSFRHLGAAIWHLWHTYIEKPNYPKQVTVWCGFWSRDIIGPFFFENKQGRNSQCRSLSGHIERIFVHQNWRGRCWQHLVSTGRRYVPHSRSYTRCFTPAAAELMSLGHLGAAIWHRWTIICGMPSNISFTPTNQRQLTL